MTTEDDGIRVLKRQQIEHIMADSQLFATLAQGAKADTSVQPAAIGTAVYNSGGLVIHGSASALAKTVNTIYGHIGAALFSKAAADMAALSGTVTNAKFNVFVFMYDGTTLTTAMGTEAATFAAVVFPTVPSTKAVIGFLIINPTGTGNFVGGTTALDDATVTPNAVYVNTVGTFVQPA